MNKKYLAFGLGAVALVLNLMIPACGSKNSINSPYASSYICTTGQVCTGVNGTPMFPAAILTSIDSFGSGAQMQIYASGYTAGSNQSQVTVQAQVYIAPNNYGCPPGTYYVQGTGNWAPNYGNSLGLVTGVLSGSGGFQVQLNGEVHNGQDTSQSQATQFYYQGSFGNSCDPNSVAL
jgi:hypothetical protein